MYEDTYLSSHINNLKSLIRQLVEIGATIEDEDAKAILLNSLSSNYDNVAFTLSQLSSWTLDEMIVVILVEEKRIKEGDKEVVSQTEIALFSKGRMNKNKISFECFYYWKHGHTRLNCKIRSRDLLNGKLKESTNIDIS